MAILTVKDNKLVEAVGDFLRKLLETKAVDALMVPQETHDGEGVWQALVEDVNNLKRPNPIAPVFPVNSARIVSAMTVSGVGGATAVENEETGKIAVVLRPCEIRALVELVKLKQVLLDNILIIGYDCWGAYPVKTFARKAGESKEKSLTDSFIESVRSKTPVDDLRTACQMCLHPTPTFTDLMIDLIGMDKEISIRSGSEKGRKILEKLQLEDTPEPEAHQKGVAEELAKRKANHDRKEEIDFKHFFSTTCINCHNCMKVCPICYCHQCVMDGPIFKYEPAKYITWAKKKKILKLPTDTYLFHFTRMNHIASSCVACGQCQSACPNDIPLAKLYHYLSKEVQDTLDYEAGRSLADELPFTTYKEEELHDVEN